MVLAQNVNRILTHLRIVEAAIHGGHRALTAEIGGVQVPLVVASITEKAVTMCCLSQAEGLHESLTILLNGDPIWTNGLSAQVHKGGIVRLVFGVPHLVGV